MWILT